MVNFKALELSLWRPIYCFSVISRERKITLFGVYMSLYVMLYVCFFSIYMSTDLTILTAIMLILFVKHVCKSLTRLTEINFSSLST